MMKEYKTKAGGGLQGQNYPIAADRVRMRLGNCLVGNSAAMEYLSVTETVRDSNAYQLSFQMHHASLNHFVRLRCGISITFDLIQNPLSLLLSLQSVKSIGLLK